MPAFNPVILFARYLAAGALTANHHPALLGVDLDLVPGEPGHFGGQDEGVSGFVQVDRRCPAGRVAANKLPDLVVQGQQIAERIPA